MNIKTTIVVKFSVEGLHNWPEARAVFPQVAYLSDLHRHQFFIECEKLVTHSDRDVEFICFRQEILSYLSSKYYDVDFKLHNFGRMSCEQIGLELLNYFGLESCKVFEDGENGAIVKLNYE